MSIKAINWAWQASVKGNQKLVLLALADHADDKGQCWPGVEGIAEKCGISRSSVFEHIQSLIDLGLISKQKMHDDHGYRRANLYVLNIEDKVGVQRPEIQRREIQRREIQRRDFGAQSPESGLTNVQNLDGNNINHHKATIIEPSSMSDSAESDPPASVHFVLFWTHYPRKEKKKQAREVWKRKRLDKKIDVIIADIEKRKKEHVQWLDGFIPHATTYLNGERWEDEIQTKRSNPTNGTQRSETKCTIKDYQPMQAAKRASKEVIEENLKKINQHLKRV